MVQVNIMMKIQNIAFVLLLSFSVSSWANSKLVTIYGKANVSAQYADEGEGSFTEIKSNASRVGVKGEKALDGGLSVFYHVEWQVDLADISDSDNIKSRNQYIGLKGSFGKVMLGRNDTILKQLHKKVDLFNDYEADLKGMWKGENRMSDSLTYFSPKLNGFTFGATYIVEDDVDAEDGLSLGVSYGDKNLKKSQWYASLAADYDVKNYDTQSASVQGKLGDWTLGAILHNQKPSAGGESKSGITGSAQYSINSWKLKAQIQTLEDDESISIGADYILAKSTKVYVWYTDRNLDQKEDKSWLAVGLEHKF